MVSPSTAPATVTMGMPKASNCTPRAFAPLVVTVPLLPLAPPADPVGWEPLAAVAVAPLEAPALPPPVAFAPVALAPVALAPAAPEDLVALAPAAPVAAVFLAPAAPVAALFCLGRMSRATP